MAGYCIEAVHWGGALRRCIGADTCGGADNSIWADQATFCLRIIAPSLTMSGIEVAGLIFGVLPILVEAVKAYSHVADALHTFRHYSREVKSVSLQLKVHKGIFLNHCRLLLRLVQAEDILDNANDWRWTSKELNDKMNAVLMDNFELCCSIIKVTKDTMDDMTEEMKSFEPLKARKSKVRAPSYLASKSAPKFSGDN
jgi:hypothetical protein